MLKQLANVQVWVHDQDEALAYYTEKLGLELREDVTVPEMGNFRWLSVGVPGQDDVAIVLMAVPGPPVFEEETREQIHALLAKGASGGLFFVKKEKTPTTSIPIHLDVAVEDVEAAVARFEALGARVKERKTETLGPFTSYAVVMADPEENGFCVQAAR